MPAWSAPSRHAITSEVIDEYAGRAQLAAHPIPEQVMRYLVGLFVTLLAAVPARPAGAQEDASTLYARFGGYDALAQFVDTAFPRVAGHPQLRRLFQGHSRDSQVRQRQLIIQALCQATGGPCAYIGRDLKTVHVGLGITDADWAAFIGVITGALDELGVAATVKDDFLELFERRLRPTVVVP
jgi:hemoglobin